MPHLFRKLCTSAPWSYKSTICSHETIVHTFWLLMTPLCDLCVCIMSWPNLCLRSLFAFVPHLYIDSMGYRYVSNDLLLVVIHSLCLSTLCYLLFHTLFSSCLPRRLSCFLFSSHFFHIFRKIFTGSLCCSQCYYIPLLLIFLFFKLPLSSNILALRLTSSLFLLMSFLLLQNFSPFSSKMSHICMLSSKFLPPLPCHSHLLSNYVALLPPALSPWLANAESVLSIIAGINASHSVRSLVTRIEGASPTGPGPGSLGVPGGRDISASDNAR